MKKISLQPDKYLTDLLSDKRADMQSLDSMISSVFRKDDRAIWRGKFWGGSDQIIIGYGDWSYERSDKKIVNWFKVGLAMQKNYISLYINAVENGQYVTKKYADKLGKAKVGSSSVSFKELSDINTDELEHLLIMASQNHRQVSSEGS